MNLESIFTLAFYTFFLSFNSLALRVRDLHRYELQHGEYAIYRAGTWKTLLYSIKDQRPFAASFDAFISYRRYPDESRAKSIANELTAKGLNIAIITDRIDETELADNVGDSVGINLHISNRVALSSTMIVVFSKQTYKSLWTATELVSAMMTSNAVVILVDDKSSDQKIIPSKYFAFKWLLTAPIYLLRFNKDQKDRLTFDCLQQFIRESSQSVGRFKLDLLTSAAIFVILCTSMIVAEFIFDYRVDLYGFLEMVCYLMVSWGCALFIPCRKNPSFDKAVQRRLRLIQKGTNADIHRIGAFIYMPSVLLIVRWVFESNIYIFVPLFILLSLCWNFLALIPVGLQLMALGNFAHSKTESQERGGRNRPPDHP